MEWEGRTFRALPLHQPSGPVRFVPSAPGTDHEDVVEVREARGASMTPGGLTDDVLTQERRARSPRAYLRDAVDRLAGADPGLTQLRMALQSVLGIAVGVGLVWLFIRLTGALQLPAGAAPAPGGAPYDPALAILAVLLARVG